MDRELACLAASVAAIAACALAQAVDYRLRRSLSGSYLAGLAGGLACLGALLWRLEAWKDAEGLALGLVASGIYLGGFMCFLAVVGLGISLRLRILSFLVQAGRPMTEAEIEARFEGGMLVERRLERLLSGGHVALEGGRLRSLGTWITRVALFNALVKRFLTGKTSEFS